MFGWLIKKQQEQAVKFPSLGIWHDKYALSKLNYNLGIKY